MKKELGGNQDFGWGVWGERVAWGSGGGGGGI